MEVGDILYNDRAVYPHDILTYMDGEIVIKKCYMGRFVFLYQDFLDFEWSAVPMFRNLRWGVIWRRFGDMSMGIGNIIYIEDGLITIYQGISVRPRPGRVQLLYEVEGLGMYDYGGIYLRWFDEGHTKWSR